MTSHVASRSGLGYWLPHPGLPRLGKDLLSFSPSLRQQANQGWLSLF